MKQIKNKFFIITTVPMSLDFFKGNLSFLNNFYEVCAISSEKINLESIGEREHVRTKFIPMHREISLVSDFICLLKFIYFFYKERPLIVHGNTPKASFLSMIAAWLTRVPIRIYMCHGLRYQGCKGFMRKLLIFMEKLSCSCATRVLCVSFGVQDTLVIDKICSINKAKVVGYGSASGVDIDYFSKKSDIDIRVKLNICKDDFVFIYVGRIVADKGINELIRAFSILSNENSKVHLVLVGSEEKNLNPISVNSSNEIIKNNRIHAVGKKMDIRPYLAIANVMTFPSYREGFGMVLIEAAAMNVPAISSNIIGCNEIIEDGVNGKLIPTKDYDALYRMMKWFYEHQEQVKLMSDNARKIVVERYERKKVWNLLLSEYKKLEENL